MLESVAHHATWLEVRRQLAAVDAARLTINESDIPNRELARLTAVSQPLASAWLQETPYRPAARQLSAAWRVAVQRRLGLYLSDLVPALSAAAAAGVSFLVGKKASTPADPLGDSVANSVDFHPRHDAPLPLSVPCTTRLPAAA